MIDAENAEYVTAHLPQGSHRDDPAVALSVDDGLGDVCGQGEAKENGVEVGGADAWAEVWPLGFGVIFGLAVSCHCCLIEARWEKCYGDARSMIKLPPAIVEQS